MRKYTHWQGGRILVWVLGGLLSWSSVSYGVGPVFTTDVFIQSDDPDLTLIDMDIGDADWVIETDEEVNEAFSLQWTDDGSSARPLMIESGAPQNAVYVDGTGRVGLGTAAPQEDFHIAASSPGIRFEASSGLFPQTWDLLVDSDGFLVSNRTDGTQFPLYIRKNDNIGMGTILPNEAVDVVRSDTATRFQLTSSSADASHAPQFIQRRARGPLAAVQNGDNLGLFSFRGMRPNGFFSGSQATITVQATQDWTNSARGTRILFGTTPNGSSSVATVLEITHDGKVKINGTQLAVPDYVFADEYQLMPLDDLKTYITQHHHLPEVASEAEVKREGIELGGTQMTLLRKIEELTLYTLQQHDQLRQHQEQLAHSRQEQQTLQEQNTALQRQNRGLAQQVATQAAKFEQRLAALEHHLQTLRP